MSPPTASRFGLGLLPQAMAIGSLLWGNFQAAPAAQTIPHKEGVSALYAIRASDGIILWHFTMNNGKNGFAGWFSVEEGVIFASVMDSSTPKGSTVHIYTLQRPIASVLVAYVGKKPSSFVVVLVN